MRWHAEWPSGTKVVWRGLRWSEYRKIENSDLSDYAKYIEVYRLCVVEGPAADQVGYGVVHWVGRHQLERNPFSGRLKPVQLSLQSGRSRIQNNYLQQARAVVAAVFRCSFEEIDSWDAETFFDRVAQAEVVLSRPIEPVDPNAQPLKQSRPPRPRR